MRNFVVNVNGKAFQVSVEEVGAGASAPVAAPVVAAPVAAPAPIAAPAASAEEEIVAAIIAAITAARAEEGIPASTAFKVVSFRKRK